MAGRYIIVSAGKQTRWANYLDVPKHYAPFNDEPLTKRTIRQLKENHIRNNQIYLVSLNYNEPDINNIHIQPNYTQNADADKFLSSAHLWHPKERTVIIYGDVYFTDKAIQTITSYQEKRWTLFCRPTPSKITGCPWGECFAFSFYPKHQPETLYNLHRIATLYKQQKITRCGGWELSRAMLNLPDNQIRHPHLKNSPLYYKIDDLTDDIDYPQDYNRLTKAIAKHDTKTKPTIKKPKPDKR